MQKFPITKEGYEQINNELKTLKTSDRPKIIIAIAEAREQGDLSENADYQAAREKQSFIEGRIQELEDKIARSEVIDISTLSGENVKFGATVKVIDCETDKESSYRIVGEYEADLQNNMISIVSPLAKAMIGKTIGEFVEVRTPNGDKEYEIKNVQYE